jgi:hypothetical protein
MEIDGAARHPKTAPCTAKCRKTAYFLKAFAGTFACLPALIARQAESIRRFEEHDYPTFLRPSKPAP